MANYDREKERKAMYEAFSKGSIFQKILVIILVPLVLGMWIALFYFIFSFIF